MSLYVKKPIPVEARQITIENADELSDWSGLSVIRRPNGDIIGMMCYTLEGMMTGHIGDYLIKDDDDKFCFCSKFIFEKTYEDFTPELDPNTINLIDLVDQPDGSAILHFDLGSEAIKKFAEIGMLKVLTDASKKELEDEIDTNVGC